MKIFIASVTEKVGSPIKGINDRKLCKIRMINVSLTTTQVQYLINIIAPLLKIKMTNNKKPAEAGFLKNYLRCFYCIINSTTLAKSASLMAAPPLGGMVPVPLIPSAIIPSSPPAASILASQAALSPFFGAPARPIS